ncbi:MAG: hypothetical protein AAF244_02110 [Pseudomonadota bacterium]
MVKNDHILGRVDKLPKHLEEAASIMKRINLHSAMFIGGAVRDLIRGQQHSDIDAVASGPRNNIFWDSFLRHLEEIPAVGVLSMRRHFKTAALENLCAKQGLELISVFRKKGTSLALLRLAFVDSNNSKQMLDLKLITKNSDYSLIQESEAPINAMTLSMSGELRGDKNSLDHAQRGAFVITESYSFAKKCKSLMRFSKINNRLGNLHLEEGEKKDLLVRAWASSSRVSSVLSASMQLVFLLRQRVYNISDAKGYVSNQEGPGAQPT